MQRIRRGVALLVVLGPAWVHAGGPVAGFDVVFANNGQRDRVCVSTGSGLACADVSTQAGLSSDVALGDVNKDDFLDAVFSAGGRNRVCLGDGTGGFSCSDMSPDEQAFEGVALADVNGDRNLDAVFAAQSARDNVCLGGGDGTFSCSSTADNSINDFAVALGDVNGDTFPDAVFASVGPARVCFNDGNGAFPFCGPVGTLADTSDVALARLNPLPVLGAVFTRPTNRSQTCNGNGAGAFVCSERTATPSGSRALVIDNKIRPGGGQTPQKAVFAGDAVTDSTWCSSSLLFGPFDSCGSVNSISSTNTMDVGTIDLDGDGLPDLIIANNGAANEVCINTGTLAGGLFSCAVAGPETNNTRAVATVVKDGIFEDSFESLVVR